MATKPKTISSSTYNINELPSDRRFEELLHRIFEYRAKDDLKGLFDRASLMPGVAEKGIDVLLQRKGKNDGVIQCKLNTSGNFNKPEAAKEIIKFALHYIQDKSLINDLATFKYYLVCSRQFTSTAIMLLGDFKNKILGEKDFQKWTQSVLDKYTAFKKLTYASIEKKLKNTLTGLNVTPKSYSEINGWLNKYEDVVKEFFEVKKVLDSHAVEKGIKKVLEVIDPDLQKKAKRIISKYTKSAQNHLNTVKFIGHDVIFNRPRNVTVSKLYVEPHLIFKSRKKLSQKELEGTQSKKKKEIKIHDVFKYSKHYIVLGDPGVGKSLMVKSLMLKLIKGNGTIGGLKKYNAHIPFRIELRKYNEKKIKNDISIISYLASLLETKYQITGIDKAALAFFIENKPTLFFFDGLDEIFDVAQKNNVRDDIVNFVSVNKNVKCLVTSRFVGYQDNSFPEELFDEFSIKGFNDKQIEKFVEKFYITQIPTKSEREKEIESCKNQLLNVDYELKSNPLILSLMALLAINKIIIPDSKLEVYRACTNTLVETRDTVEKELNFNLKVKSKRGTFGHLGYWQYCQMTDKKKVDRILVKKAIADFLKERKEFVDIIEAEAAAEDFLKYAEARSIYFDDNFMHKTFLEYYAADYIFARFHNCFKHDKRDSIIAKNIHNSAWHIVFELLIAMIDEQVYEPDVLDNLITNQIDPESKEINSFFIKILPKIENIGSEVKKTIIRNVINIILKEDVLDQDSHNLKAERDNRLFYLLVYSSRHSHLQSTIQDALIDAERMLKTEQDEINFYTFFMEFRQYSLNSGDKFEITKNEKIDKLKTKNISLFSICYFNNFQNSNDVVTAIIEQVKCFGVSSIFKGTTSQFRLNSGWVSIFQFYFMKNTFTSLKSLQSDLERFSRCGLTSDAVSKYYYDDDDDGIHLTHYVVDKIKNILSLYLKSKNRDIDNFIQILFTPIYKKRIIAVGIEFEKHPKYKKLLKTLDIN